MFAIGQSVLPSQTVPGSLSGATGASTLRTIQLSLMSCPACLTSLAVRSSKPAYSSTSLKRTPAHSAFPMAPGGGHGLTAIQHLSTSCWPEGATSIAAWSAAPYAAKGHSIPQAKQPCLTGTTLLARQFNCCVQPSVLLGAKRGCHCSVLEAAGSAARCIAPTLPTCG